MKRIFNLCLVATLLSFGAACSKKSNSKSKEFEKSVQTLKDKQAQEKDLKERQDNAIELSNALVSESDEDANIALYQILLAADINGSSTEVLATTISDADVDHDKNAELVEVSNRTGIKNVKDICDKIAKKLSKKADNDLIRLDRDSVQKDIDATISCRSLNIESNYIEVSKIKALCEAAQKVPATKAADETKEVDVDAANPADVNPAGTNTTDGDALSTDEEKQAEADKLKNENLEAEKLAQEKLEAEKAAGNKSLENPETPEEMRAEANVLRAQADSNKKEAKNIRITAETKSKKERKEANKEANALEKEAKNLVKKANALDKKADKIEE